MSNNCKLKSIIMTISLSIFGAIIIGYAGINAYLYFCQRSILYLPVKEMAEPKNYGLYDTQEIHLTTKDGVKIIAWYKKPKHNEPIMVYFQGNKGNLGDRVEKLNEYINTGMGMLAVSWRGYGGSEGSPSEEGLYNDARAAIDYLTTSGVPLKDIFLYGESLGTGIAVQMATEYDTKALVLEAPYTSISTKGAELYPYIPVKLLLKDHFDSIDKIGKVKVPVMIFHGYLDQVMPIIHGRKMLQAANEPKQMRIFDHVGHTDFDFKEIARLTHDFVHGGAANW